MGSRNLKIYNLRADVGNSWLPLRKGDLMRERYPINEGVSERP